MEFFSNCSSQSEAKKLFHKLALLFHPDRVGDTDLFIELKKQYDSFRPGASHDGFVPYIWYRQALEDVQNLRIKLYHLKSDYEDLLNDFDQLEQNRLWNRIKQIIWGKR